MADSSDQPTLNGNDSDSEASASVSQTKQKVAKKGAANKKKAVAAPKKAGKSAGTVAIPGTSSSSKNSGKDAHPSKRGAQEDGNDGSVAQDVEMEEEGEEEEEGGIRIGGIYLPPPPPPACTFDSNGPRLVITFIENEFFKSYAGRQVSLYLRVEDCQAISSCAKFTTVGQNVYCIWHRLSKFK